MSKAAREYLWDKKGGGDAETRQLEELLGAARFAGLNLPGVDLRPRRWPLFAGGALLAAAVAAFLLLPRGAFFEVREADGTVAKLYVAKWFETGATSAEIRVAEIGQVQVQPGSRVRLLRTDAQQHRLELSRGSLHAKVSAPPRLFVVETPAATAVDLGCEYDLGVDADGVTRLQVRTGQVELVGQGKRSIVVAGMECSTRAGKGPGTPVSAEAPAPLRAALERLDNGEPAAVEEVLALVEARDAVTLWHLLSRVDEAHREAVYARLNARVAAPAEKARVLALEPAALEQWWAALNR